ncbi:N-acetylmuramate/N-acetylglucosamine kinase AmgK [Brevundimonas sp.]|uniref:N-acetylmuramate/N-acetylglucosamine kinase AmgK n=1 Tax=Brevundimonas sp. TaxID=1871086 RepID=UPI001D21E459|nr:phosphotransferase [Brevundimonas sp.]MBL0948838.1 phosphotransferase [Brevundimonas sp.]
MSERQALIADFLAGAGLAGARRDPLPGDASTRRYERLTTPAGSTLMLMDQAPALESPPCDPAWTPEERRAHGWNATARLSAGRIEAFAAVADHLRSVGLSAPEVVALDAGNGLAILEDLGDDLYARVIEQGAEERPLYLKAVEALARLHLTATLPDRLSGPGGDWPLLTYDATALQAGADLFIEWMPKLIPDLDFSPDAVAEWRAAWAPVAAMGEAKAWVMAHRDYHAENLLWLPGREGFRRVGLIDFQDAVLAHPVWDLHSLLQDARRDVSPEVERAALDHYVDVMMVDGEEYRADYAALAALNEARILGVFARLIARDGKPRYRQFMPRMWGHLEQNLKRPELSQVRVWFDRHVPKEMRG